MLPARPTAHITATWRPGRTLLPLMLVATMALGGCKAWRMVARNAPDLDDHRFFPERLVRHGHRPFFFHRPAADLNIGAIPIRGDKRDYTPLQQVLRHHKMAAFILIRRDTILYERYDRGYGPTDPFNGFSIAKAMLNALVGIALAEGYLPSLDEPVTTYLPELRDQEGFGAITLQHLMSHTSGIRYRPQLGNPWGDLNTAYYGRNLRKYLQGLQVQEPPGTRFVYNQANTQLLGWALSRATGRTLSSLLEEKIWRHAGMEAPATWSLDRPGGDEKAFCCVNARAMDFARFGRLYLNNGQYQGTQLVPEDWVRLGREPDTTQGQAYDYRQHWLLYAEAYDLYLASGLFEQAVIYSPSRELILVSFNTGHQLNYARWKDIYLQLIDYLDAYGQGPNPATTPPDWG